MPSAFCEPSPQIAAELEKAREASPSSELERVLSPLAELRRSHPRELAVHEAYQDAVQRYGIEGHLRKLTEEFQVLSIQDPDDLMFAYLYARSLIGRNTPSAIGLMTAIVAEHADFSPAHRSLAEIYASAAFHNAGRAKLERKRLFALCPGSVLRQLPWPLPEESSLLDQAERSLDEAGDPEQASALALQGIHADEHRLQRIRPFDWYSVEFKRRSQRTLQARYWRFWSLEVRCYRRTQQLQKAADLLAEMERRAVLLRRNSDPGYWDAASALVRLYAEDKQRDSASQALQAMRQFLDEHPDAQHSAQLQELQRFTEMAR